eukprot:scaffold12200_cov122-Cylindrotheca_fusiformis.AAC.3
MERFRCHPYIVRKAFDTKPPSAWNEECVDCLQNASEAKEPFFGEDPEFLPMLAAFLVKFNGGVNMYRYFFEQKVLLRRTLHTDGRSVRSPSVLFDPFSSVTNKREKK